MRKTVTFLLLLAWGGSAQGAVTEPQPPAQSTPRLKDSTQTTKPSKLTAEQEVVLVEVRKILQEARQVAEGIELPNRLMTNRHKLKAMEQVRKRLLEDIEAARLRAGDFTSTATQNHAWLHARALAKYGRVQEAAEIAGKENPTDDNLLVIADLLIQAGDTKAALQVVDASTAKEQLQWWRDRKRAAGFSLIARRQYERGDPGSKETLERALTAAQAIKVSDDRYRAFVQIARAQVALGDQTGSAASFREAKEAALELRDEGGTAGAFTWIAKAQGEARGVAESEETFRLAIQLRRSENDPIARTIRMGCLAWAQAVSGNRRMALESLRLALLDGESLSPTEKIHVLRAIGDWQLIVGEREAAIETIQRILKNAESTSDLSLKAVLVKSAGTLAVRARDFKTAMQLLKMIVDDEWDKASAVSFIASTLIKTKDPFGTQEVFQQLVQTATGLQQNHLPKDPGRRNLALADIAFVQAAAGDMQAALDTADRISDFSQQMRTYRRIVSVLATKGDQTSAEQALGTIKDEWFGWYEIEGVVRGLAQAGVKASGVDATISFAQRQSNPFAKAEALIGVGEGMMEHLEIEDIQRLSPVTFVHERCPIPNLVWKADRIS